MRIDALLYKNKLYPSRNKAQEAVLRGEVFYKGNAVDKCSFDISEEDFCNIKIIQKVTDFVSVGGFKLEKALFDFDFSVKDLVCIDVGASTGGFTDCLLKRGAKKVYAVDLNDGLLDDRLKADDRVKSVIKNARFLSEKDFGEKIDLLVADLSFISLSVVLPIFSKLLSDGKFALVLIKPQFENDAKIKFKNGIIKDNKIKKQAIEKTVLSAAQNGFIPLKLTDAPKVYGKNSEYLILMQKDCKFSIDLFDISTLNIEKIL